MKYGSVCSGIEAATAAWHDIGFEPVWFSEIEKFPCAVLQHHYPKVPNLGDMTKIHERKEFNESAIDLLVGGTPCQSFSVAGLRKGLADPRGNLALVFLSLIDRARPKWVLWENVPGVLSSNEGKDFGAFLGGLGELGYGWAYRVLDAQYFGVPQRRRRVFVVGHLGNWQPAAAVLFERQSMSGNPPPSREKGKGIASGAEDSTGAGRWPADTAATLRHENGAPGYSNQDIFSQNCANFVPDISPAIKARDYKGQSSDGYGDGQPLIPMTIDMQASKGNANIGKDGISPTLSKMHGHDVHAVAIPIQDKATRHSGGGDSRKDDGSANGLGVGKEGDPAPTITSGDRHAVAYDMRGNGNGNDVSITGDHASRPTDYTPVVLKKMSVRRLTPKECERLQGFPDDYTQIPHRGKPAADGPRYKALGNSMAVPVMRWIGKRIMEVEEVLKNKTKEREK